MADFTDSLRPRYDGTATLQAEREASDIHVDGLASHLLARDGFLERQEKVLRVLSRDKLFDKDQQMNLSRPERYHLGLARAKAIVRIMKREGWDHNDYKMCEYLVDEMSPYHLHMTMFGGCRWLAYRRRQLTGPSYNGPGARVAVAKEILAATDSRLFHRGVLRPDRTRPREQRPRPGDRRQVRAREPAVRPSQSLPH